MRKQKTSKTASKRIQRVSSSGKILRKKILAQHLVHRKTRRTIKEAGIDVAVSKPEVKKVKRLIPYGVK